MANCQKLVYYIDYGDFVFFYQLLPFPVCHEVFCDMAQKVWFEWLRQRIDINQHKVFYIGIDSLFRDLVQSGQGSW